MSVSTESDKRKVTVHTFQKMKERGEKITMLTAYDYTMASILDQAGLDAILVGDSASNVMAGNKTTLPLTLDEIIFYGKSVVKGVKRALVVVDMPFGTCSGNPNKSLKSAIRIMKETGADSLKIEGGKEIESDIQKIINAGIPVMGHLGLMPQSINKYGDYSVRAKADAEAEKLKKDALLLQELGCYSITLEKIPSSLAQEVATILHVPVIGIGAGAGADGQVLVVHDMLGMNKGFNPKFVRQYADLHTVINSAVRQYVDDVRASDFPSIQESY
ncbi:3-methyl-2-oxobutanoate hydroxymethyltransferase [Pontibacter harenae]|uniref:3-methyl-2-oxobutanoate hydroxymethyltransferase n=1 Tax=Pontibacter harenae TaxID=2894083 RepID=UPI001E50FFA3|nr:3-methyl-2-oxobutanoate hydroxymethyltransferase [Pontibacter harenae]MCC9169191.1 3-methyl-2-oxobutanoate hydroxymethyltransferase [Pontibacter harenae]MCC9169203.1 3-methyl-2-oxobutanoate hydroxymethyltransferase [Pontibacter harenae]